MNNKKIIPLLKVHMPSDVQEPILNTLSSGFITEGPRVKEFENLIAEYIGNQNVTATSCCTGAIQIALQLAHITHGDEVISTPMTCQATNQPIMQVGANIVWADIEPDTGNIAPSDIQRKVTEKTKAIVMMHWAGQPCDLDEINEIAKVNDIKVIEDAASSFGASYKGKMIGNHSDFICFSFGAVKHITTGDGGVLALKDESLVEKAYLLKNQGNDKKAKRTETEWYFDIKEPGWKFGMNDIAATIGICQMNYVNSMFDKRAENAKYYDNHLINIPGLKTLKRKDDRKSANWIYTLIVENKEDFARMLKENGIGTSIVHQRNDIHTLFKNFKTELPNLDRFYEKMINIPLGWWVNEEDREFIVSVIKRGW